MSAELLRRAAEKLREHANAASFDANSAYGGSAANANYIALMHPPVALALADVLDLEAARVDSGGIPAAGNRTMALAREILREPQ